MSDPAVLFSVITVTRNDLSGLRVTHESLKRQSLRDVRWIVIDGASSDGSVQWLEQTLAGSGHVWISEPDKSLYDAMNKGLDRAREGYALFLNSGDTLASDDTLALVARAIAEHGTKPCFVYGDAYDKEESGALHLRKARDVDFLPLGMFARHQAMYFLLEAVGTLRYRLDLPCSADYAFVHEFLRQCRKPGAVCRVPAPLCVFGLGGVHETRRLQAIGEDHRIRRAIMHLPLARSLCYTGANVAMHYLKKITWLSNKLIYAGHGRKRSH